MKLDVVSLTQAMVRIPSLSGHEAQMAALMADTMHAAGFDRVHTDANGSVVGIAGPADAPLALLFDGHMDVVPVTGDWRYPPFGGEIHAGRLYGRGSTDMKGGVAAAICAAAQAIQHGGLRQRVAVSASVLEEVIEGHALATVLDDSPPQAVVICEPSQLQIRAGQKGRVELLLQLHGKPAHAAHPHRGVNPLHAASRALAALATLALPTDPVLGAALLVPTDIISQPYPSISMIPQQVEIRFDRRTITGETLNDVLDPIRAHLQAHGIEAFTLSVNEDPVRTYTGLESRPLRWLPAWRSATDCDLLAQMRQAVQTSGYPPVVGSWPFCTNGSESAGRRGIPTIGLGPGHEEDAHIIDESVAVDELRGAVAIYANLIAQRCQAAPPLV